MRVLIIDDDTTFTDTIKDFLKTSFTVDTAPNGTDGTYMAQVNVYDIIVLDIVLPDIDGIEVCRMIRSSNVKTPVIMLTGKDDVNYKVFSLDSGADDYLTKPFSSAELMARIRALLRRSPELLKNSEPFQNKLKAGDLVLDVKERLVWRSGEQIHLRRKEFDILELLLRRKGVVVSKECILESVWDLGLDVPSNTVEVHVSSLRKKIDKKFSRKLIKTIFGVGYKLVE
jgi:DNA-binding response OmpR family regulator